MCDFCTDLYVNKNDQRELVKPVKCEETCIATTRHRVYIESCLVLEWMKNHFTDEEKFPLVGDNLLKIQIQYCPACGRKLEPWEED